MLCYVMLCYVMLCYVMLCYVMLCYVMLCYVMLCYVMLCYVMLAMLCFAIKLQIHGIDMSFAEFNVMDFARIHRFARHFHSMVIYNYHRKSGKTLSETAPSLEKTRMRKLYRTCEISG